MLNREMAADTGIIWETEQWGETPGMEGKMGKNGARRLTVEQTGLRRDLRPLSGMPLDAATSGCAGSQLTWAPWCWGNRRAQGHRAPGGRLRPATVPA